ncbi:hypothetical protein [Parvicella tangerina]|uniref:Uncharacterized protein n=1 Tax=Parvicella tangerina TaxID=2829795 RepID=A0A916JJL1_9FLAO|nr:hypothetical protein [Parvicella tangerina]CAG5077494.1 hypothetical protein CRYO30217_00404 [Parvicella tangerina]
MKKSNYLLLFLTVFLTIVSCNRKGCTDDDALNYEENARKDDGSCEYEELPPIDENSEVEGYGILEKLPGIWNGPVSSPTPLGSFPEWIVDFRPISASQVSAKNELDSVNDIFMSFFICKYDHAYKIAFRNGGGFAGNVRNSYMIIDSVNESSSQSFYRFVDPVAGGDRVYTDVTFKGDSLLMHTYTNQYNTLSEPVTHMIWRADLRDTTSTLDALTLFDFPQKELTRDFSTTFDNEAEAVYYSAAADPYPEEEQPYLGECNVSVSISNPATVDPSKKVLIIITTQPLFNGFNFNPANLDYRSRYVFVGAQSTTGYDFNYMHPGEYYVNAIYDNNGDYSFSSGDFMNSQFDQPFTLSPNSNENVGVTINFQIP